ncbi:uncharacterized protein TNCV_326161 [Trichonephila clavipes]|nr:uncharacterized protein TNCV_326161 [Trichonephila clavipes]
MPKVPSLAWCRSLEGAVASSGVVLVTWPWLKRAGSREVAAVAEWSRYWIVAALVTSFTPVPLKTCRVGQRCTLNLSRTQTPSRWCGVVVRRGGSRSGVIHVA